MSRSARLRAEARRQGWLALMMLSVATAAGTWAVAAWLHGSALCGVTLLGLAAIALRCGAWHAAERLRLRALADREVHWRTLSLFRL
ncbi:MAG: hypothetical protein ACO3JG_15605 [Luteolibacter sp.]